MTRARVSLAIAFSALALTACGGGGDKKDGDGTSCSTNPTGPGCTPSGNKQPVAKANGPYQGVAGAAISLSAAGSSDPEDRPENLKYEWLRDNVVVATGSQANYTFATAGTFTLTLRVTDSGNLSATDNASVTVAAPATTTPGGGTPPAGSATGTMVVTLTDAPFPFDSVQAANVFVARVDAQIAEPTVDAANSGLAKTANTDPNAGWVTVAEPNRLIDVFALQGGVSTTLGQAGVAAGTYRGFRLVLDAAQSRIVLKGGAQPAIQWGATGLLGVKITPAASVTITGNAATSVPVDFDLGRSFDLAGATPGLGFTYVRQHSLRTIAASQTGSDVGRITVNGEAAPGITIELLTAGTAEGDMSRDKIVATAVTDAQGVFRLTRIEPGSYVRRFTFPQRYRVAPSQGPVTIAAGATASRGFDFESLR